jgi:hypothetical protein
MCRATLPDLETVSDDADFACLLCFCEDQIAGLTGVLVPSALIWAFA